MVSEILPAQRLTQIWPLRPSPYFILLKTSHMRVGHDFLKDQSKSVQRFQRYSLQNNLQNKYGNYDLDLEVEAQL
jgi:hypothetical protein